MTQQRRERQGAILQIVQEQSISTQAELARALRDAGHEVVQTTVSRDVAELGLVKVRDGEGRLVYTPPGIAVDGDRLHELAVALRRWALTLEASGNLVIVTTPSGYANALGQVIDTTSHPKIAGTVAGDNTILVVARDGISGAELHAELRRHLTDRSAPTG